MLEIIGTGSVVLDVAQRIITSNIFTMVTARVADNKIRRQISSNLHLMATAFSFEGSFYFYFFYYYCVWVWLVDSSSPFSRYSIQVISHSRDTQRLCTLKHTHSLSPICNSIQTRRKKEISPFALCSGMCVCGSESLLTVKNTKLLRTRPSWSMLKCFVLQVTELVAFRILNWFSIHSYRRFSFGARSHRICKANWRNKREHSTNNIFFSLLFNAMRS